MNPLKNYVIVKWIMSAPRESFGVWGWVSYLFYLYKFGLPSSTHSENSFKTAYTVQTGNIQALEIYVEEREKTINRQQWSWPIDEYPM